MSAGMEKPSPRPKRVLDHLVAEACDVAWLDSKHMVG